MLVSCFPGMHGWMISDIATQLCLLHSPHHWHSSKPRKLNMGKLAKWYLRPKLTTALLASDQGSQKMLSYIVSAFLFNYAKHMVNLYTREETE